MQHKDVVVVVVVGVAIHVLIERCVSIRKGKSTGQRYSLNSFDKKGISCDLVVMAFHFTILPITVSCLFSLRFYYL